MAVKIRLRRVGKVHMPYYRIVVTDSRTKRDGRFIEQIGKYHPKDDPSYIEVDSERAQHWLGVGAQPSDPVRAILRKTGDWQKFKGEPAPAPLLQPKSKRNRDDAFNEALKEAGSEPKEGATTAKKRSTKKAAAKKVDAAKDEAAESKDAEPKDAEPKAEADAPSEAAADAAAPAADAAAADAKAAPAADAAAGDAKAAAEAGDDASTS